MARSLEASRNGLGVIPRRIVEDDACRRRTTMHSIHGHLKEADVGQSAQPVADQHNIKCFIAQRIDDNLSVGNIGISSVNEGDIKINVARSHLFDAIEENLDKYFIVIARKLVGAIACGVPRRASTCVLSEDCGCPCHIFSFLENGHAQRAVASSLGYATQMPGTATFWNRCGEATAEDG
jgi:hypothetical protein